MSFRSGMSACNIGLLCFNFMDKKYDWWIQMVACLNFEYAWIYICDWEVWCVRVHCMSCYVISILVLGLTLMHKISR